MEQSIFFKNDMASTDVSYKDLNITIANAVQNIPSIFSKSIYKAPYFKKSLVGTLKSRRYTWTAAANTLYSVTLDVYTGSNSETMTKSIFYDTTTGAATDAAILAGLTAAATASGLKITATGASNHIDITATTDSYIFFESNLTNLSGADNQTTYTPNATPATALSNVIAPDGTAGNVIGGTSVVTVTSAAAHLLRPGDYVQIAGAATFLMTYTNNVPLSNNADYGKTFSGATGGLFRVATVPSPTTFTLDGVTGNGLTNTGASVTITMRSTAKLVVSSTTITEGKTLTIGNVLTATIANISANGTVGTAGTSGNFRVGVGGTGTTFLLEGVYLDTTGGTSSGVITITELAQLPQFQGADLIANSYGSNYGIVSADSYSEIVFEFSTPTAQVQNSIQQYANHFTIYFNETKTDSALTAFSLTKVLEQADAR